MDKTSLNDVVKTALTEIERDESQKHEKIVDEGLLGYLAIGEALGTIRDGHLHVGVFKEYVWDRFEIPYHSAVRKIHAARVALNLQTAGLPTPSNEAQAYELQDLEPEAQIKTWKKVLKMAEKSEVRITTDLIRKVQEKKSPRTVKVQDESHTVTVPQTASFAASSGERPQGPVETAAQAVGKAASEPVSQSASNGEKPQRPVETAIGKALANLQIALGALENVEVAEAEPLDTMLTEITGLVAHVRPGHRYGASLQYVFVLSKGRPRVFNPIRNIENWYAGHRKRVSSRLPDGTMTFKQEHVIPTHRMKSAIWHYNTGLNHTSTDPEARKHPASMGERLAEDLIVSWSRDGDVVLDPMNGSGTTAKMALLNNRRYLGFEIHQPYHDLAVNRLRKATNKYLAVA